MYNQISDYKALRTLAVGQVALPTEQLGCVPQVVEWGTPGIIHAGVVRP